MSTSIWNSTKLSTIYWKLLYRNMRGLLIINSIKTSLYMNKVKYSYIKYPMGEHIFQCYISSIYLFLINRLTYIMEYMNKTLVKEEYCCSIIYIFWITFFRVFLTGFPWKCTRDIQYLIEYAIDNNDRVIFRLLIGMPYILFFGICWMHRTICNVLTISFIFWYYICKGGLTLRLCGGSNRNIFYDVTIDQTDTYFS